MRICTRYRLVCRIRHHMRKRRQYRKLQEYEYMVYGSEAAVNNELWQKMQWHFRYSYRLKQLLDKKK